MGKQIKCFDCGDFLEEVERDVNAVDDGIDWVCYECANCGAVIYEEEHTY